MQFFYGEIRYRRTAIQSNTTVNVTAFPPDVGILTQSMSTPNLPILFDDNIVNTCKCE